MSKAATAGAGQRTSITHTVKVTTPVHTRLTDLVNEISSKGWRHLGVSRNGVPTFSSVIEEALKQLKRKV